MGLFGKLLKTGWDVVNLPVDVVKDVVSPLTETEADNTVKRLERLADDSDEVRDELDNL